MASIETHLRHLNKIGKMHILHQKYSAIGVGAKVYLEIRVGAEPLVSMGRRIYATGGFTVDIWRGATLTQGTTPVTILRPINDLITTLPLTTAFSNPTAINTTSATLINRDVYLTSGSGNNASPIDAGDGTRGSNVYRPNTTYILEITNNHNIAIDLVFEMLFTEQTG